MAYAVGAHGAICESPKQRESETGVSVDFRVCESALSPEWH
jgi:hypothetical protein